MGNHGIAANLKGVIKSEDDVQPMSVRAFARRLSEGWRTTSDVTGRGSRARNRPQILLSHHLDFTLNFCEIVLKVCSSIER